jgi:hypothetical protein
MCITNIYTDRFPDGKEVEFRKTDYCQYGSPDRPCDKLSEVENPVRIIQYGEHTTEYMLTMAPEELNFPEPPRRGPYSSSPTRRSVQDRRLEGMLQNERQARVLAEEASKRLELRSDIEEYKEEAAREARKVQVEFNNAMSQVITENEQLQKRLTKMQADLEYERDQYQGTLSLAAERESVIDTLHIELDKMRKEKKDLEHMLQSMRTLNVETGSTEEWAGQEQNYQQATEDLQKEKGVQSQPTDSSTELRAQDRKQRDKRSHRVHDIEFATEIATSLLSQVRNLQALLAEKEETLKSVTDENSKLKLEMDGSTSNRGTSKRVSEGIRTKIGVSSYRFTNFQLRQRRLQIERRD